MTIRFDPSTGRRIINGYLDMGGMTIPPLPQGVVMTDRVTGKLWLLSHLSTAPVVGGTDGRIMITDVLPRPEKYEVYGPYDGPWIQGKYRLLISNGQLGFENDGAPKHLQFAFRRILTIYQNERKTREIVVPTNYNGSRLGWAPENI